MKDKENFKEIFRKAKNKYKNTHYLRNHSDYFPIKSNIDILYFKSEKDNSREHVLSYLRKNCRDKFYARVISLKTKIVGYRSLRIISEIDMQQQKLYYVYYKSFKDMLLMRLKREM